MTKFLLGILLLQGAPQPVGFVTGRVVLPTGMPAAGIRVYAMAVRDAANGGNTTVLESLAQTDEMGRYRLEVPPGRYYIAAGSVDMPTYFPGTSDLTAARIVSIAAGAVVEAVDFSRFVPANRSAAGAFGAVVVGLPPGSTGVLSGVLRYPDGSPAAGQWVIASPAMPSTNTVQLQQIIVPPAAVGAGTPAGFSFSVNMAPRAAAQTDSSGRYRISNVSPGTYYIVTGYADSPFFYPGTPDVAKATTITTTPSTSLDTLNLTVPAPPPGVAVQGRVTTADSRPVVDAAVSIRTAQQRPAPTPTAFNLPMRTSIERVPVRSDGSFEFRNVSPGEYVAVATLPGASAISRNITVTDQPITSLDFSFPIANLTGRVLFEDGTPFSDGPALGDVAISTVNNPSFIATTLIPIDKSGNFTNVVDANQYRFYFRVFPDDYVIKSITAGAADLTKGNLKVTAGVPANIELRVAKRTETTQPNVRGRVLDSKGAPSTADRVQLCCFDSGPFEQISTAVQPDGSFGFSRVPPGRYSAGVHGRAGALSIVDSNIEVGTEGASGITLLTTPRFLQVMVAAILGGGAPPAGFRATVSFTSSSGLTRVTTQTAERNIVVSLPAGDTYRVQVTDVPAGYRVKSLASGSVDLLNSPLILTNPSPPSLTVMFEKQP